MKKLLKNPLVYVVKHNACSRNREHCALITVPAENLR